MADLLDQTLAEIRARLKELGPVVAEYERLAAAAEALNGGSSATQTSRTPARRRSTASASPRAPRGANKQKVYAAIDARPGATAAELAKASGVAKPIIYNLTRQGVKTGELEPQELPSGGTGFTRTTPEKPRRTAASNAAKRPARSTTTRPKPAAPPAEPEAPQLSDESATKPSDSAT